MVERNALNSMGEEFIEARFDPKYRQLFQDKISELEQQKQPRINQIPVRFRGEIDPKVEKAIRLLVDQIFAFANDYGLTLSPPQPEVVFFSLASWEKEANKKIVPDTPLPASRLQTIDNIPHVQIILPPKITSNEVVINTVRTLFSKLFGQLYFQENVPTRPPYNSEISNEDSFQFDEEEKARFCRLIGNFPPEILVRFTAIGKKIGAPTKVAEKQGEKIFFSSFLHKEDNATSSPYAALLQELFDHHGNVFRHDPEKVLTLLEEKIFATLPQTYSILPHEQADFHSLRSKSRVVLFHALVERILQVVNMIDEIDQCRKSLESVSSENSRHYDAEALLLHALEERMKNLKHRGLVKIFLIPGAHLSNKQIREKAQFPLWLWRHVFAIRSNPPNNPGKELSLVQERYKNSVYQKVFETCERMSHLLKKSSGIQSVSSESAQTSARLKSLFAWFDFRKEAVTDMLYAARVGRQLAGLADVKHMELSEKLTDFEKAWSYFISFAMIHLFYLKLETKTQRNDKRAEQFYGLIRTFISERIATDPVYRLVELFRVIYEKNQFQLGSMIRLIRHESPALDFFVQHQNRLFKPKPVEEYPDFIYHYANGLCTWLKERDTIRIDDDYIVRLKEKGFSPSSAPEKAKAFI